MNSNKNTGNIDWVGSRTKCFGISLGGTANHQGENQLPCMRWISLDPTCSTEASSRDHLGSFNWSIQHWSLCFPSILAGLVTHSPTIQTQPSFTFLPRMRSSSIPTHSQQTANRSAALPSNSRSPRRASARWSRYSLLSMKCIINPLHCLVLWWCGAHRLRARSGTIQ